MRVSRAQIIVGVRSIAWLLFFGAAVFGDGVPMWKDLGIFGCAYASATMFEWLRVNK